MGLRVSPAGPADLPAACRLLAAGDPDRAARYLDLLAAREFDPAGVFVARDRAGAVVGAMLAQRVPGALGLAWPPRADSPAAEDALTAAACRWLRAGGVKVCQAFAPDPVDMAPLGRAGFRLVTHVVHFRRAVDPHRDGRPPGDAGPLALDPAADPAAFAAALLATYDGSLDCPELTGTRTLGELAAGFAGPLAGRAGWRVLARHPRATGIPAGGPAADRTGGPVGVVVLDPGTEPGAVEVSYLGLVPAARGRGWGDALVRYAVGFAARGGAVALTLSVDARNDPARRLYARHGFRPTDRRAVYLADWPPPPSEARP